MDARLDTLTIELYQVNTHVSRITRRQARMGSFAASSSLSPSLEALEDEDDDDGLGGEDDVEDEDALPVMRRWPLLSDLPFVIRDKKGGVVLGWQ